MRRYGFVILVALLGLIIPAQASATLKRINDVPYGSSSEQIMDIYPQTAGANAPIIVMVHGGGWASYSLQNLATISGDIWHQSGAVVFNIDYRLDSPEQAAFPMQVEDTEAATRYAIAHSAEYGGNPNNVILFGASAGGQLVAMAAEHMNTGSPGTVHAVVTLSGPFNLPALLQNAREKKKNLTKSFIANIQQALGCSLDTTCETPEAEEFAREWSPVDQLTTEKCPTSWLMFNSSEELIPIEQANQMTELLEADGCSVSEQIVPGKAHATAYWSQVSTQVYEYVKNE